VFIEIGSDESHWSDVYAGEVIARSIVDSVLKLEDYCLNCKSVVGVGGPHYANNFMELMEKSDYCVGHMIPKYALSGFDRDMVHQLIMRTDPKPDLFVLDYKGLGPDKQRVKDALSGFNWKKTSDLKGDVVDKNEC
jgi:D-aminoacyl-tRNA deacylase